MIKIKSEYEIELMRRAGQIAAIALKAGSDAVRPGITTMEIDDIIRKTIEQHGAIPSFLGYNGFPKSACISINEEVIHGIPGKRKVKDGDIVKIDAGAIYRGYHGDCATTVATPGAGGEAHRLIDVTRQSFYEGIKFAVEGNRVSDISHAIQRYVERHGFSAVRKFVGHGVGSKLHEAPEVPNYGAPGHGPRLCAGMTLAVEPMINEGSYDVEILSDGWTVVTSDRKLSAHYEHSFLITKNEAEILTVAT